MKAWFEHAPRPPKKSFVSEMPVFWSGFGRMDEPFRLREREIEFFIPGRSFGDFSLKSRLPTNAGFFFSKTQAAELSERATELSLL